MAYDSGKRLLLYALVKGLGDAARRNDQSAAKRYRRRLRLAAEQIAADDPVQDALKKLLLISGQWVVAPAVTMSPKGEGASAMFIVAPAMNPSSKCLNSSNALSACSHRDNISGSAVALLPWLA